MTTIPTIGRIVHYRLSEQDAEAINRRREHAREHMDEHRSIANGVMVHVGNHVNAGELYPATIVKVWSDKPQPLTAVNLKVHLDGTDDYWATSVCVDEDPEGKTERRFVWPGYVAPAPKE